MPDWKIGIYQEHQDGSMTPIIEREYKTGGRRLKKQEVIDTISKRFVDDVVKMK